MGLIRTQELLAATRGYGVRLFFTSAKDFGFSKTPEETEKIWGDQVLADMVRVIRVFRPDIVINNFGGVHSGHGHHQAAGLGRPGRAAGCRPLLSFVDRRRPHPRSNRCVPDLDFENPWGGADHPVQILDVDRSGGSATNPASYQLPSR